MSIRQSISTGRRGRQIPSCGLFICISRLRGDVDEARAELAESLRLKPDISSFARWRSFNPTLTNTDYLALSEKTLNLGLRRAGFPEE
jgi:hypothetical protein